MGTCCSVPSVEEAESAQQFRQVDTNRNSLVDRKEMSVFVKNHAEMWAMLSVNLGKGEEVCQETATRVAMELASGKQGSAALQSELTEAQFHAFRSKYMIDGKGAQEFFHRCVFASFVKNGKQYLDANQELDEFLETFYKSGSIFEGDTRLPPKEDLKERITRNNPSGQLTFDEIRDVIRGTTSLPRTSTTKQSSVSLEGAAVESAPEETPEPPKELAPPSIEFTEPEQTPEVQAIEVQVKPLEEVQESPEEQPLPPPSPKQQQRPRQRKPKGDRAASRSRSPSQRRKSRTDARSRSPSQRIRRASSRSGSPSRRIRRTTSRSSSPSQRKPRTSGTSAGNGSPSQPRKPRSTQKPPQPQSTKPRRMDSGGSGSGNNPAAPKRKTNSKQPQKPKDKRQ